MSAIERRIKYVVGLVIRATKAGNDPRDTHYLGTEVVDRIKRGWSSDCDALRALQGMANQEGGAA